MLQYMVEKERYWHIKTDKQKRNSDGQTKIGRLRRGQPEQTDSQTDKVVA